MSPPSPDAPPAGETTSHDKRGTGLMHFVLWTLVALAVYVLSIGPAFKLQEMGVLPGKVLSYVYEPVWFLTGNYRVAKKAFDWYIRDLWHYHDPNRYI